MWYNKLSHNEKIIINVLVYNFEATTKSFICKIANKAGYKSYNKKTLSTTILKPAFDSLIKKKNY